MFWEVGLLVTTLAAAISASIGDEPPQGGSGIDATGAIINKSDPFGGLDANGVIINEAELPKISGEDIDFYNVNSIEERKGCSPTISCTRAGGYCIKDRAICTGTVDKDGCKGGKKCKCCIPDETTPSPVTCPPVTPCPTAPDPCLSVGGERISSQCLIFSSDYKSWHEARTTCQGRGQRLAVPRDPVAFDAYARSNHDGIFYLGASDINKEGTWTWINGQSLGSSFPWGPNEPNDNNGNEDCLEWGRGANRVYNDGVCTTVIRYICELDETTPPPVTCPPVTPCPAATGICPSPFRLRGNECLFIPEYLNETLNWDESRQKCLSMRGDLAQPQDMVDFVNFLEESYPGFKPSTVWLGATDREVEQEWKWLSGESVPPAMWEPWIGNQPSGDGNCMEIHKWPYTEFFMNDWYCHNKGYFACEIDETTPPPVTCPAITPCPTTQECSDFPGFLPLLGTSKCVKVFDNVSMTWYEANLKCQREGLTPVKTSNVNALEIRNALVDLSGDAARWGWLDARFNGVQYVWGDGEVIANDNVLWHPGHPILRPDHCMVILNSEGFIRDSPTTAYWTDACTNLIHPRKAFCEFDLNSLRE